MRKPIKDAVYTTTAQRQETEPAVWASTCAGCGDVFDMRSWAGDSRVGVLEGAFDRCATDRGTGKSMGNVFSASVCGFACADKVMKGGWRDIEEYRPFADEDAVLVRAQIKLTALVARGEREILEQAKDRTGSGSFYRLGTMHEPRSVMDLVARLAAERETIAKIKEVADRAGVTEAEARRILEAEALLRPVIENLREGRAQEGGVMVGGYSGQSYTVWTWDGTISNLARAAGILSLSRPDARGAGELTHDGWRVTREARGEPVLALRELAEVLLAAEEIERGDEQAAEEIQHSRLGHGKGNPFERACDGAELAMAILKLAEEKGYKRVLGTEGGETTAS